jgi:hypothetical protein
MNLLRAVLLLVCGSHLLIGGALLFGGDGAVALMARAYGATRGGDDPAFLYMLKPLGAYMIAIGAMAGAAIVKPWEHRIALYGVALLLVIRVAQRWVFAEEIREAFGVTTSHRVAQSLFFFAIAAALIALRPRGPVAGN